VAGPACSAAMILVSATWRCSRSAAVRVAVACRSSAVLRQDTGYQPAYDTDRAVADYLAWLRAGHER